MGFFIERVYHNSKKVLPICNAQKIAPLIDKEVEIKDINGRSWTVGTSYIDGSLAFGRGWSRFVTDHGIENNMQLLFQQISRSKFRCEIYSAEGTMKLQFPSTYQDTDSSSSTGEGLSNSNTTEINEEVSVSEYMGSNPDRRWLLVPSEFEMYKITNGRSLDKDFGCSNHAFEAYLRMLSDSDYIGSTIHGENFGLKTLGGCPYRSATAAGQTTDVSAGLVRGAQTTDFNGQTTAPSDQGGRGILVKEKWRRVEEKRNFYPNSVGGIAQRVKYKHLYQKRSAGTRGAGLIKKDSMEFKPQHNGSTRGAGLVNYEPMKFKPQHIGSTSGARLVKKEPMESKPQHIGSSRGLRSVKKDPVKFEPQGVESNSYRVSKKLKMEAEDFTEPPPAVTCAVASDSNYLELPWEFPSSIYSTNRNVKKEVECVMDPSGRLWPVMWCRILDKQILSSGWKSIRDANRIQTGDVCFFSRDEDYQGIMMMKVVLK